ncbi:hypothetical protein HAX54_046565 [Datura stramonium]|uniref:Uncharacterized protein n=1 Tax=Datura stramonium TaxID=4076 RepID=A0ABS8ST95_DATST|nr:hypothetical protein [Datura stramonium]
MEVEGQQLKKRKQLGEDSMRASSSSTDYWRYRNKPRKFFDGYSLPAGLVVDLTNTDRYYPKSDWTSHGIRHVKIRCPGQDSVPDAESVDRFISEVVQFTSQESQASKYAR